jgi:hypothetical protein
MFEGTPDPPPFGSYKVLGSDCAVESFPMTSYDGLAHIDETTFVDECVDTSGKDNRSIRVRAAPTHTYAEFFDTADCKGAPPIFTWTESEACGVKRFEGVILDTLTWKSVLLLQPNCDYRLCPLDNCDTGPFGINSNLDVPAATVGAHPCVTIFYPGLFPPFSEGFAYPAGFLPVKRGLGTPYASFFEGADCTGKLSYVLDDPNRLACGSLPPGTSIDAPALLPNKSFRIEQSDCVFQLFKGANFINRGPPAVVGPAAPGTCTNMSPVFSVKASAAQSLPPPPNATVYAALFSDNSCGGTIVDYVAAPGKLPCEVLPAQGAEFPTREPIPFGSFKVVAPNCKVTWYQNANLGGSSQPDSATGRCVVAKYAGSVSAFSTAPPAPLPAATCHVLAAPHGVTGCECDATVAGNAYRATCLGGQCHCSINGNTFGQVAQAATGCDAALLKTPCAFDFQ